MQTIGSLQPDAFAADVWLRFGWSVVAAALLLGVARRWPALRRAAWPLALLAAASMWLPGEASPAWWMGLAFQSPSLLLVALCACSVLDPTSGAARRGVLDRTSALTLVLLAALLYGSVVALLPIDLYRWGSAPLPFAAVGALVAVGWWLVARPQGRAPVAAVALGASLLGYALLRLPTGNAWDAVLDPWLALWALATLLAGLRRRPRLASASAISGSSLQ